MHFADRLLKTLDSQWLQICSINFGPQKDNSFKLKYDIPFFNAHEDVIILEAEPSTQNATGVRKGMQTFPKSFRLQRERKHMKSKMHVVGYPSSQGADQIQNAR